MCACGLIDLGCWFDGYFVDTVDSGRMGWGGLLLLELLLIEWITFMFVVVFCVFECFVCVYLCLCLRLLFVQCLN